MVSLVSFLDENARRQPDHLACVVGDDSLSYAELRDASGRFAGALGSLGLQPGNRVSLYMPNSAAYVACYLGVMRAGMIANPVNGVAQVVEVTRHLAGRTGTLAHRPDAGLTHCTGGGISGYDHAVCTVHVLTAT
jgi:long-chain acyl-CoA synthetase